MYIGIDIGGSNIAAGLVTEDGALTAKNKFSVTPEMTSLEIISNIKALIKKLLSDEGFKMDAVKGIGIGVPGSTDSKKGEIIYTSNLPFKNTPIAALLSDLSDAPIYLENDANCAALGELYAEGGDISDMIFLTLGTGIGGGIIIGGKIYGGFNSAAGEVGHMVIEKDGRECGCGRRGCWERYASASGLIISSISKMKGAPDSIMWSICEHDTLKVSARTAFAAAKLGDAAALEVIENYYEYLACGMTNLINIFEPQIICLGGGISNEPDDWLLHPVNRLVEKGRYRHGAKNTVIKKSKLGSAAGIIGAAMLCRKA